MTLVILFASVGYLIVDLCAIVSVLGSAIILLFIIAGRMNRKIPEQLWT
jgi:C4-dicarboxylate transporter